MPPQQESRCWILVLVVGLFAVTGLTGVTLWFALRASDDVGHSQHVGEHDWGSTQEQALVEEVVSTSTARDVVPEPQQHLEVMLEQPDQVNDTSPSSLPSPEHQDQQVSPQPLESIFVNPQHREDPPASVRDTDNVLVHPEEVNKVMVHDGETVVQQQHLPEGENGFLVPEQPNKPQKTNPATAQKTESVFRHPEHLEHPIPVIGEGVNAFVNPEQSQKLKMGPTNAFAHPQHLEAPMAMIGNGENVFEHPEDRDKLKRMDLGMTPKGENLFMHPEHPSIMQRKEPGLIHGYRDTFLPPEDDEHRNQLENAESEDEHFFSQYFEYPHDRDHHGQAEGGRPPWETEHEEYLYKGPEQYDGEEPEYSENPIANFLQHKLQDLYNWISSDEDLVQGDPGTGRELLEVVEALNRSLAEGNSSLLVDKLKQIYQSKNGTPDIVHSNSLASFGFLAFDLMLLRNVQQIAWEEDNVTAKEMMQDPDVMALSALFLPPEEVRQLQDPAARHKDVEKEDKGALYDIMRFINGSLRAVLNLGRAYRDGSNVLDCVWTLYCRNLDKSARLRGPYGFLARINSMGLRLAMGEFPLENTLELLAGESSTETAHMDCDKLFPRCKTQEAAEVVLRSTLG